MIKDWRTIFLKGIGIMLFIKNCPINMMTFLVITFSGCYWIDDIYGGAVGYLLTMIW